MLQKEFIHKDAFDIDSKPKLSNSRIKPEQTMEYMVRNQILNKKGRKVSQTSGDTEDYMENDEDENYPKRRYLFTLITYSHTLQTEDDDHLLTEETSNGDRLSGDYSSNYLKKLNKKYKVPPNAITQPCNSSQDTVK